MHEGVGLGLGVMQMAASVVGMGGGMWTGGEGRIRTRLKQKR